MESQHKIIDLLAESLKGQDRIVEQLKESNSRLDRIESRTDKLEGQLVKLEGQLVKLNLQTTENTRPIFKLPDNVEHIADLHNKSLNWKKAVFK